MLAMRVVSALIRRWSDRIDVAKLVRYGAVSVIATTTSLVVLGVLVGVFAAPAGWSNVVATAVGTVPSFELNRRWVWQRRGHRSLGSEIAPFSVLSFAGLALSTLAVQLAASATGSWPRLWHTVAVEVANIGAFGSLWVLQFVLLDRVLFRRARHAHAGPPEAHGCMSGRRGAPCQEKCSDSRPAYQSGHGSERAASTNSLSRRTNM
jgi:putative flippase GtrA